MPNRLTCNQHSFIFFGAIGRNLHSNTLVFCLFPFGESGVASIFIANQTIDADIAMNEEIYDAKRCHLREVCQAVGPDCWSLPFRSMKDSPQREADGLPDGGQVRGGLEDGKKMFALGNGAISLPHDRSDRNLTDKIILDVNSSGRALISVKL